MYFQLRELGWVVMFLQFLPLVEYGFCRKRGTKHWNRENAHREKEAMNKGERRVMLPRYCAPRFQPRDTIKYIVV